jgi:hypothetical protein
VTVRILTAERLDYTPRDSATLMCYSSPEHPMHSLIAQGSA